MTCEIIFSSTKKVLLERRRGFTQSSFGHLNVAVGGLVSLDCNVSPEKRDKVVLRQEFGGWGNLFLSTTYRVYFLS